MGLGGGWWVVAGRCVDFFFFLGVRWLGESKRERMNKKIER